MYLFHIHYILSFVLRNDYFWFFFEKSCSKTLIAQIYANFFLLKKTKQDTNVK